jgi:hypothetical protein
MLTSVLHRICFRTLVTALTATTWSSCQAVGSFQTKPAFPSAVTANDPLLSESAFFGGCGKGRISDPQTHGCRGPADMRNIAR